MNRRKLLHAVIGVIVSLVGTPLLGGGITGYLEGSELKTGGVFGLIVGGVSGGLYVVWELSSFILDVPPEFRVGVDGLLFQSLLGAGAIILLLTLCLGGVGGLVGSYIAHVQQERQVGTSTG